MNVLFAVWELVPFFQVGGLGDIAHSLPKALSTLDVDVRVILPYYKALKLHNLKRKTIKKFNIIFDGKKNRVEIFEIQFIDAHVPVYLIKNDKYLSSALKDTFMFFDLAVVEILKNNCLNWTPQIVHCNDHHTGFIPFLIKHNNLSFKTLLTIHNLGSQGKSTIETISKANIDSLKCKVMSWEIKKKQINFLLEGIIHADLVNTVSRTYAKEILTEEYGSGLDDILRNEKQKISGILNGLDYDASSPLNDMYLQYRYKIDTKVFDEHKNLYPIEQGRKLNKAFLQEKLGFDVSDSIPLVGFIGRFYSKQKGLDIMHKMLRRVNLEKYQFVFLGHGEQNWEDRFNWMSSFYPKHVSCHFIFDGKLASQIYAGCDFLMVPSKFEPCGLIQMIAMHYGALPIVRATGGLKDSIEDGVDGFLFNRYSSIDLEKSIKRAVNIRKNNPKLYFHMVENAMRKDFSWKKSAQEYLALYNKLLCNPLETF